jgi:hypothetical protein
MLGRQKCIQLSHLYLNLVPSRIKLLLKSWKDIKHQALIKFWKNWSKQEVIIHYVLKNTNLLLVFGIRKNCHINERNLLLYLFIKTDCSNCRGLSLLLTTYRILSNILLSRLTPYIRDTGDHQCVFRCNRLATDQIFCIYPTLKEKCEYKGILYQLFIDFKNDCDSGQKYCTIFSLNLVYLWN